MDTIMERGCGTRVPNHLYATMEMGKDGKPLDFFLYCPPKPIQNIEALSAVGINPVGFEVNDSPYGNVVKRTDMEMYVEYASSGRFFDIAVDFAMQWASRLNSPIPLVDHINHGISISGKEFQSLFLNSPQTGPYVNGGTVYHFIDVIGVANYKYACDFIQEAFHFWHMGQTPFSRKIPRQQNILHKISWRSKLLMGHAKGWLENWPDFMLPDIEISDSQGEFTLANNSFRCPKKNTEHNPNHPENMPCQGILKNALDKEDLELLPDIVDEDGFCPGQRTIGATTYYGYARPKKVEPVYQFALLAWMPLNNFEIPRGENAEGVKEHIRANIKDDNITITITED